MPAWTGSPFADVFVTCSVFGPDGRRCCLQSDHPGDLHESWDSARWFDDVQPRRRGEVTLYLPGDGPCS